MLCRLPEFQQFMSESYGDNKTLTEDMTATLLCNMCGIDSRTELNGNADAKQLFDDLMLEYHEWKLNATPF
jgi:hypothetical protein